MATFWAKLFGTEETTVVALGGDFAINDHQAGVPHFSRGEAPERVVGPHPLDELL